MPDLKARVLTADPAWQHGDGLPGEGRGARKHYKTQSVSEIMRQPLPDIEDDAILFLWFTSSMPLEALEVCKAWGFTPKSQMIWCKSKEIEPESPEDLQMGMGHYTRGAHEPILLATRGKFKVANKGIRSVFFAPRGEHSAKPELFYSIVEQLCGEGPFVEMYARRPRFGWHTFGDELPQGYIWTPRDPSNPRDQTATPQRTIGDDQIAKPNEISNAQLIERLGSNANEIGVDEDRKVAALVLGRRQNILTDDDLLDQAAAWSKLLLTAPDGWFRTNNLVAPGSPAATEPTTSVRPADAMPFENFSELVQQLATKGGIHTSLVEVSAWTILQRDLARAWLEQGANVLALPPFMESLHVASNGAGCAACDRGEKIEEGREWVHTGLGAHCKPAEANGKKTRKKRTKKDDVDPRDVPTAWDVAHAASLRGSDEYQDWLDSTTPDFNAEAP